MQHYDIQEGKVGYRESGEGFDACFPSELVQEQDGVDYILGPWKAIVCLEQPQLLKVNTANCFCCHLLGCNNMSPLNVFIIHYESPIGLPPEAETSLDTALLKEVTAQSRGGRDRSNIHFH